MPPNSRLEPERAPLAPGVRRARGELEAERTGLGSAPLRCPPRVVMGRLWSSHGHGHGMDNLPIIEMAVTSTAWL